MAAHKTAALAWLLATLLAAPALAQRPAPTKDKERTARAKQLFKEAEVHFSVREFEKALKLYKEAFKLKPLPELLFNLGQCQRYLGDCEQARFYYRQFLLKKPDTRLRAEVERLIAGCKPTPKPSPDPVAGAAPGARPGPGGKQPGETAAGGATDRGRPRALVWAGVGLGGALLVTSAVTGALALKMNGEYQDEGTTIARREELRDTGQALEVTFGVTLGLGIAVAAGTVALHYLTGRRGAEERAAHGGLTLGADLAPGRGALLVGGRF